MSSLADGPVVVKGQAEAAQHRGGEKAHHIGHAELPHRADYFDAVDMRRFDGYRSGELARFMGYLIRQLHALGELLVFDVDFRDIYWYPGTIQSLDGGRYRISYDDGDRE